MTDQLNGLQNYQHQLQQDNEVVGPLLNAVVENQRPHLSVIQRAGSFILLLQQWNQLYIHHILLFRCYEDCHGGQCVVSLVLQNEILHDLHSGATDGHTRHLVVHERDVIGLVIAQVVLYQLCPDYTMRSPNKEHGSELSILVTFSTGGKESSGTCTREFTEKFLHSCGCWLLDWSISIT